MNYKITHCFPLKYTEVFNSCCWSDSLSTSWECLSKSQKRKFKKTKRVAGCWRDVEAEESLGTITSSSSWVWLNSSEPPHTSGSRRGPCPVLGFLLFGEVEDLAVSLPQVLLLLEVHLKRSLNGHKGDSSLRRKHTRVRLASQILTSRFRGDPG